MSTVAPRLRPRALLLIALLASVIALLPAPAAKALEPTIPVVPASALGGPVRAVAPIAGSDLVLIGAGSTLTVLDVGDPDAPRFVYAMALPNQVNEILVRGDKAYVAHDGGLSVVDLPSPAAPALLATYPIDGQAISVTAAGNIVYAGVFSLYSGSDPGLIALDVANPSAPIRVWSSDALGPNQALNGGYITRAQAVGSRLYVAYWSGFTIFDVSAPASPQPLAVVDTEYDYGQSMYVDGARVYLVNYSSVKIYSAADPANIVELGRYRSSEPAAIVVDGDHAFLSLSWGNYGDDQGLEVLNVADPATPYRLTRHIAPGSDGGRALAVTPSRVYVANESYGLHIFARTEPAQLDLRGTYREHYGSPMARQGDFLYTFDSFSGWLQVIDAGDPTALRRRGSADLGMYPIQIQISGTRAYVLGYDNDDYYVVEVDISRPDAPAVVSSYALGGFALDMAVGDGLVYVALDKGETTEIRIVDARSPAGLGFYGWIDTPDGVRSLAVEGATLYYATGYLGNVVPPPPLELRALDITDPHEPQPRGSLTLSEHADQMVLQGGLLYLYWSWNNIWSSVDISDPDRPQYVLHHTTTGGSLGCLWLTVSGTTGYCPYRNTTFVYDLSNPAAPTVIAQYEPGYADYALVDGDWLYLSGRDGSLRAMRTLSGPTTVSPVLSTLSADKAQALGDGVETITVTVTLRDHGGQALAGRRVYLTGLGEGMDMHYLAERTDSQGRLAIAVRSSVGGTFTLSAREPAENVRLSQPLAITFMPMVVPPDEAMAAAINVLGSQTNEQLAALGELVQEGGATGDRLRRQVSEEQVEAALAFILNTMLLVPDLGGAEQAALNIAQPGVKGLAKAYREASLSWIKDNTPGAGRALFNSAMVFAIEHDDTRGAAQPLLFSGAAALNNAFAEEQGFGKVPEFATGLAFDYLDTMAGRETGMTDTANWLARQAGGFQERIELQRRLTLSGVGRSDEETERRYLADLEARRLAATTLLNAMRHEALFQSAMEAARDSLDPSARVLFAKFILSTAIGIGCGPPCAISEYAAGTLTDALRSHNQIRLDLQGTQVGYFILKQGAEYAPRIYLNAATGMERVRLGMAPQTVTGSIGAIALVSEGEADWAGFWRERRSYVEIPVTNTGPTEADFEVYVLHGYGIRFLQLPWSYMPLTSIGAAIIPAGETRTVRIELRAADGSGGSPDQGDRLFFYVLGSNETGTFAIGSRSPLWSPQRRSAGPAGGAALAAGEQAEIIENPISTFVGEDQAGRAYEAQLLVTNPFSVAVDMTVTQPLAPGMQVLSTDGSHEGDAVVWRRTVPAESMTLMTARVRPGAPLTERLELQAATLSFQAPGGGEQWSTVSNPAPLAPIPPVTVAGSAPPGTLGASAAMALTVSTPLDAPVAGTLAVSFEGDPARAPLTAPFSLAARGSQALTLPLPADLPQGLHTLRISALVEGTTWPLRYDVYAVEGPSTSQVYLPMVRR